MAEVKFKYGSWDNYNALSTKDNDTLYFITDKQLFFKGSVLYGHVVTAVVSGTEVNQKVSFTVSKSDGNSVSFDVPTTAALTAHCNTIGGKDHGHVKLSDAIDSQSSTNGGVAATPNAVRLALDAAKAYADGLVTGLADAMVFKGTIGAEADDPTVTGIVPPYSTGWTYKVITDGTYVGKVCEVGDMLIAINDAPALQSVHNEDWVVVQSNIDGAVTAAATLTQNAVVLGNGTKTVKTLANGSDGQVLKMVSGAPQWEQIPHQ